MAQILPIDIGGCGCKACVLVVLDELEVSRETFFENRPPAQEVLTGFSCAIGPRRRDFFQSPSVSLF